MFIGCISCTITDHGFKLSVFKVIFTLNEKGSVMAISDVGVGVQCLRSALTGSIMNVYINTKSMKNREIAEKMNKHARSY